MHGPVRAVCSLMCTAGGIAPQPKGTVVIYQTSEEVTQDAASSFNNYVTLHF